MNFWVRYSAKWVARSQAPYRGLQSRATGWRRLGWGLCLIPAWAAGVLALAYHAASLGQSTRSATGASAAVGSATPASVSPVKPAAAPASPPTAIGHAAAAPVGEPLTAKRPPAIAARPPVIENRPYAPITRPEDDGQIAEIEMFVGESRVFPTPGVARIAVGNGSILTAAALDGREVILFANAVGTSSLFVWHADGRYQRVKISIVAGDTSRHAREIAAFLAAMPRVKATVVGSHVILEGEDLSDDDQARLEVLGQRYPQIVNFTQRVGWEKMIGIDVKVVEFPVNLLREVGLKWTPTGGAAMAGIWGPASRGRAGPYEVQVQTGQGNRVPITGPGGTAALIPGGLNSMAFLNLGLNAQLALLAQDGQATVLAEPQLTVRNGSKAHFVAGGELPYGVTSREGTNIVFKEYGIKLDITPRVGAQGAIRAGIEAEVSSIDPSVSTAFGPGLLKRMTKTEFNLREGQTLVLAGLLQREHNLTVDKVPLLGELPVLGALFRSKRYQNKETELVVFVTPRFVDAQAAEQVERLERVGQRLEQRLGAAPHLTDPLQPRGPAAPASTADMRATGPAGVPASAAGTSAPAQAAPVSGLPAASAAAEPPPAAQAPSGTRDFGEPFAVAVELSILRSRPDVRAPALLTLHRGASVQAWGPPTHSNTATAWRPVAVGTVKGWVPVAALQAAGGTGPEIRPTAAAQQSQAGAPLLQLPATATAPRPAPAATAVPHPAAGTLPGTVNPTSTGPRTYRVKLNNLALRLTPDNNAPLLAQLREGTTLIAVPYGQRGAWTAVQWDDGTQRRSGWVNTQWLEMGS